MNNTTTRKINQYTTEDVEHFSRDSNLSSKTEDERLILKIDGEEKRLSTCRKQLSRDNRDYTPLRGIDGVEKKTVYSTGRRGRGERRSKHRYKFTREIVEQHDDVVLIKREVNRGGNVNGVDYSNNEEVARWKLVADN